MDIDSKNLKKSSSLSNLFINNQMNLQAAQPTIPTTREIPVPTSFSNIFSPRARRFSASASKDFISSTGAMSPGAGPRLTPRISQIRQEECANVSNVRELNHEREVHSACIMSQSYEDLSLATDNWSFKSSDELTNPIHVSLPLNSAVCSSPSPNGSRLRLLPYTMSPSPTRRTFSTRRSMSPCAMRPSQLGAVKRKFEMLDEANSCSSTSSGTSNQPFKKMFAESFSRGSSPSRYIPLSPSPICDSTFTHEVSGRLTPKLFMSKILASHAYSLSSTSSPLSTQSNSENDSPSPSAPNSGLSAMEIGQNENEVVSSSDLVNLEQDAQPVVSSLTEEMTVLEDIQKIEEKTRMLIDDKETEDLIKLATDLPLPRNASEGL